MLFVCVDMIKNYFSNKSLYLYFFVSYGWKQSIYTSIEKIVCCVFLRLVYSMLPVSLDCPFLITPSVFSNVYMCSSTFCIHHDKTPG